MAVHEAPASAGRILRRSVATMATAAAMLVGLGAVGLASVSDPAGPEHGAMSRADEAWADRLGAIAASQNAVATARERADAAYSERLTGQADALAVQRYARERANTAWSDRLTRLAERLIEQDR